MATLDVDDVVLEYVIEVLVMLVDVEELELDDDDDDDDDVEVMDAVVDEELGALAMVKKAEKESAVPSTASKA